MGYLTDEEIELLARIRAYPKEEVED